MSYQAPNLPANKHCFFGSSGGFSTGFYQGLNVNTKSDDDKTLIAANLEQAAAFFGLNTKNLHLLNQGVTNHVEYIATPSQDVMTADGAVTKQQGIILCIRTADCAPILLADYTNGIIGAAHAGWRGALGGVIENTIDLMLQQGAELKNITAAIGPCIGQDSYEVDEGFYQEFINQNLTYQKYFKSGQPQHYQFNLEAFCYERLSAKGITDIAVSQQDTYVLADEYYSFRRFTHQGLIRAPKCFPTELSAITL